MGSQAKSGILVLAYRSPPEAVQLELCNKGCLSSSTVQQCRHMQPDQALTWPDTRYGVYGWIWADARMERAAP